jgi:hypothetical protein
LISPDDADDRDVDIREDIGWCGKDREHTDKQDKYGEDDERVWPSQRKPDYPHIFSPRLVAFVAEQSVSKL